THRQQRTVGSLVGVVDQNVDATECGGNPFDDSRNVIGVRHLADERFRFHPDIPKLGTRLLEFRGGTPQHSNTGPAGCECPGYTQPDPLARTRHHGDPAVQSSLLRSHVAPTSVIASTRPIRRATLVKALT